MVVRWSGSELCVADRVVRGCIDNFMKAVFDQLGIGRPVVPPSTGAIPGAIEMSIGSNNPTRLFHSTRRMIPWATMATFISDDGASNSKGKICMLKNAVALRSIEAEDSPSIWRWIEDDPPPERAALSLAAVVEFQFIPSNDPKSLSRRSGVRIGIMDVPSGLGGCRRQMPSAVIRALLKSDEYTEPK